MRIWTSAAKRASKFNREPIGDESRAEEKDLNKNQPEGFARRNEAIKKGRLTLQNFPDPRDHGLAHGLKPVV